LALPYVKKGEALAHEKPAKHDEAIKEYDQAIKIDPRCAEA
jgi:hypothetical protein